MVIFALFYFGLFVNVFHIVSSVLLSWRSQVVQMFTVLSEGCEFESCSGLLL